VASLIFSSSSSSGGGGGCGTRHRLARRQAGRAGRIARVDWHVSVAALMDI